MKMSVEDEILYNEAKQLVTKVNRRIRALKGKPGEWDLTFRTPSYRGVIHEADRWGFMTGKGYLKANTKMDRNTLIGIKSAAEAFLNADDNTRGAAKRKIQNRFSGLVKKYPEVFRDFDSIMAYVNMYHEIADRRQAKAITRFSSDQTVPLFVEIQKSEDRSVEYETIQKLTELYGDGGIAHYISIMKRQPKRRKEDGFKSSRGWHKKSK